MIPIFVCKTFIALDLFSHTPIMFVLEKFVEESWKYDVSWIMFLILSLVLEILMGLLSSWSNHVDFRVVFDYILVLISWVFKTIQELRIGIKFRRIGIKKQRKQKSSRFWHASPRRRLSPPVDKNHLYFVERTHTSFLQK